MSIFAAVRKRETRRIGEAAGSAMHHFSNQRQRLQGAWPQVLQEQQRGKIAQLPLVNHSQHRSQPLQINIRSADIMMPWQRELAGLSQGDLRMLLSNVQQRLLRWYGAAVHQ